MPEDDAGGEYDDRPKAVADIDHLATRTGPFGPTYDPDFLGYRVEVPRDLLGDSVELDGSVVIPFTHFCLSLSKSRRLTRWAAWNVDGAHLLQTPRVIDFYRDRRLEKRQQVVNDAYEYNELDRGHIARRADLIWGPDEEAMRANNQSMAYPNITPQMENFNRSSLSGTWGELENAVLGDNRLTGKRVSVIAGPFFAEDDPIYRADGANVQLPRAFFKIVIYVLEQELRARTFILDQNVDAVRSLDGLLDFRIAPRRLRETAERARLAFGATLMEADKAGRLRGLDVNEPEFITDVRQVDW